MDFSITDHVGQLVKTVWNSLSRILKRIVYQQHK